EGREAEATTTLDHLGDAVDRHHALEELTLRGVAAPALLVGGALATATTGRAGLVGVLARGSGLDDHLRGRLCFRCHYRLLIRVRCVRSVAHRSSPPPRAPSAMAATRPAYLLPPRSKKTAATPAFLARSA